MKKIIAALTLVLISDIALADYWHHGFRGRWVYPSNNWLAPAIAGGVIGYELTRPVYVPPVIYAEPTVVYTEPQLQTRTPVGYHWEQLLDANCNCYKSVLVPNY